MTKSKKYRKKPRGYERKLANAPHLYNRQEPPRFGYVYNRSNTGDPFINSFHQGNRRYQDREKLESLKRLKNREGIQTGLMAENFKKIESAYYSSTAVADRITTGLKGIEDEVKGLNNQAQRHIPAMAPGGGPVLAPPALRVPPPPPGRGSRLLNRFRAPAPPPPGRRGSTGGLPPRSAPTSSPQSSIPSASPATSTQHNLPPLDPWPATRGITPSDVTTPQRNSAPADNQDDASTGRGRLTRALASPATLAGNLSNRVEWISRRRGNRDPQNAEVRRQLDHNPPEGGARRTFSRGHLNMALDMANAPRFGEVSDSNITLTE